MSNNNNYRHNLTSITRRRVWM